MDFIGGEDREQTLLLPDSLEDYVGEDNPARVIDAFVNGLDMHGPGFRGAAPNDTGRPPYDPRDILKLYAYGYLNCVRSSHRLETETKRNYEIGLRMVVVLSRSDGFPRRPHFVLRRPAEINLALEGRVAFPPAPSRHRSTCCWLAAPVRPAYQFFPTI